jgi:hypothetical protein
MPDLLYHYTNNAGLLGILTRNELWLGDVEFMNDAEELTYARDAVVEQLEAKARALWPTDTDDPEESADWCRAWMIRNIVENLRRSAGDSARTYHGYATCFCESGDLLSQWRGYAGGGGYAIGFSTGVLTQITESAKETGLLDFARLTKVRYGLGQARDALAEVVNGAVPYPAGHRGVVAWHELMYTVLPVVSAIKHPSFAEEREWRLLLLEWGVSQVEFRPGNLGLIPYRTLALPPAAIVRIVIGPGYHPEVRRAGVLQLLEKLELHDVSVELSASPLRA